MRAGIVLVPSCLVLEQQSKIKTITLHKSKIILVFEMTIPTRRFPGGGLPRHAVASETVVLRRVPIITRAALDAIFESVDVYFEQVGASR